MPFLLSIMLTFIVQTTAQPSPIAAAGNSAAVISTSIGDITVELFQDRAPVSVAFAKIAAAPTRSVGDMEDVPVEPVVIKSVTVK